MLQIQAPTVSAAQRGSSLLWAGLFGGPLFLASLIVFGLLRPGYSHYTNAVSRLGALGIPWGLGFDFFGFLLPGLLAMGVAFELRRAEHVASKKTRSSGGLLVYSGMMALTAVPADFTLMFQSPWTWVHAFFVTVPVIVFFAVIPGCARSLRLLGASRTSTTIFIVLGYLPIVEFLLYGVLSNTPGIVQRLMILTNHLSIAWLSAVLLENRRKKVHGRRTVHL